jgi:hypothetical protein
MSLNLDSKAEKRMKDADEALRYIDEVLNLAADTAKRVAESTANICTASCTSTPAKDQSPKRIRSPYFETLFTRVESINMSLMSINETLDRLEV